MAKANYNKVENALDKGLRDLKVLGLLKEADKAQGKVDKDTKEDELTPKQKMTIVEQDLKWMCKQDKDIYKILKLKRKKVEELLKLVNTPDVKLKKKDLEEIDKLREDVKRLKRTKFPPPEDEESLKSEINRHIYKRHNVREEWLPMDTHSDWDKYTKEEKKRRRF